MNGNAEEHGVSEVMTLNLHASDWDLHLQTIFCPKFILSTANELIFFVLFPNATEEDAYL